MHTRIYIKIPTTIETEKVEKQMFSMSDRIFQHYIRIVITVNPLFSLTLKKYHHLCAGIFIRWDTHQMCSCVFVCKREFCPLNRPAADRLLILLFGISTVFKHGFVLDESNCWRAPISPELNSPNRTNFPNNENNIHQWRAFVKQ